MSQSIDTCVMEAWVHWYITRVAGDGAKVIFPMICLSGKSLFATAAAFMNFSCYNERDCLSKPRALGVNPIKVLKQQRKHDF